jgi:hypothetical protein
MLRSQNGHHHDNGAKEDDGFECPLFWDWRLRDGMVSPVKNQGRCGSCWAFAAAETLESTTALKKARTPPFSRPPCPNFGSWVTVPSSVGYVCGAHLWAAFVAHRGIPKLSHFLPLRHRATWKSSPCSRSRTAPATPSTAARAATPPGVQGRGSLACLREHQGEGGHRQRVDLPLRLLLWCALVVHAARGCLGRHRSRAGPRSAVFWARPPARNSPCGRHPKERPVLASLEGQKWRGLCLAGFFFAFKMFLNPVFFSLLPERTATWEPALSHSLCVPCFGRSACPVW